jgi:hypothetical protein
MNVFRSVGLLNFSVMYSLIWCGVILLAFLTERPDRWACPQPKRLATSMSDATYTVYICRTVDAALKSLARTFRPYRSVICLYLDCAQSPPRTRAIVMRRPRLSAGQLRLVKVSRNQPGVAVDQRTARVPYADKLPVGRRQNDRFGALEPPWVA